MIHVSKGRRQKGKLQRSLTFHQAPYCADSCMNKLPSNPGYILPELLSLSCSAENHLFLQLLKNLWSSYHYAAHHRGSHCLTHAALDGVIFPCQTVLCCPSKVLGIRRLALYTAAFLRTGFTPPRCFLRLLFCSSLLHPHQWVSFLCFWEKRFIQRNMGVTC